MDVAFILLLLIIIALSAFMLYREFEHVRTRVNGLEKRIAKLESKSSKRMPFKSQDEILDAIATLDLLEYEESIKANLRNNAKEHLFNALKVGTKEEKQDPPL